MSGTATIIAEARREARTVLNEVESKTLLGSAGIAVNETRLAVSREEATALSRELGYPAVLKIISPDITHKSDVGGVRMNLATPAQTARAYDRMMADVGAACPEARIRGVSVQRQFDAGLELLVGMFRDAQFGPAVAFGLGGTLVEVLDDVALRLVPLKRRDARDMMSEIRASAVISGFRGREPLNRRALEDMLLAVSTLAARNPEISAIDLNPVLADARGAVALDARIILRESAA